jgi:hypothetical protein
LAFRAETLTSGTGKLGDPLRLEQVGLQLLILARAFSPRFAQIALGTFFMDDL